VQLQQTAVLRLTHPAHEWSMVLQNEDARGAPLRETLGFIHAGRGFSCPRIEVLRFKS
jgi:hypothetical protein